MSISSDTPRDNLTLSEADLAACRPIVGEGGHVIRALCPFHGSDRQRSLRVQVHSGRFVCFACGAWGYMDTARAQWQEEQQRQAAFRRPPARQQRVSHHRQPLPRFSRPPAAAARQRSSEPSAPCVSAPGRPDLAQQLAAFQAALPSSRGAAYLQQRGIPLALAQQLGVGYAAPGTWPHPARDWRGGRVVFPHTTPDGCLVNLYGRAVGTAEQVPKAKRHDHLPGVKGYFNAAALQAVLGRCGSARGPLMRWRCSRLACRAWWRSSACRAGAGTGRARCGSSSSRWTPMPPGSSSGASSPARRRCGGSTSPCWSQRRMGGTKM